MKFLIRFITVLLFIFSITNLNAQTTVYVCTTNGAYGFCYGNNSTSGCAYNQCIKHGGQTPSVVLSHSGKGYGAIAVGKGSTGEQIVGASAGYDTLSGAMARAKEECARRGGKNIYIDDTFHDKEEEKKQQKETKEDEKKRKEANDFDKEVKNQKSGELEKTNKKEDDFWSGKGTNQNDSSNNSNDFWEGNGTRTEEENFDKNTVSKKSNQFIGEIESRTKTVTIVCRDHGDEDGDRVQIRNNKEIIKSNLYLTNAKKTIVVNLNFGMNRLDFKALNQGTAGPNTAEFDIYDDKGKRISTKKWNLLTGFTGTLLIVKL